MTYYLLAASLALGAFFVLSLLGSLVTLGIWPRLRPLPPGAPARPRADALFALRLLPSTLAGAAVCGLLLPAYALYEPRHTDERVAPALAAVAAAGLALIAAALGRAVCDLVRTHALERGWRAHARPLALKSGPELHTAYRVTREFPLVSVVGIVRPRLFLEGRVLEACDEAQIAAILAHEAGHVRARDNLKRLLMRACPDPLAFTPFANRLERAWSEAAEAAADEHAAGETGGPLAVADALLRLARLAPTLHARLAGSLIHDGAPIATRVERLLALPPSGSARPWPTAHLVGAGLLLLACVPTALPGIHALAERLVRWLG